MGLVKGTPITDDDDIFDIAFEQEITNCLRQVGETDLSKLHIAGVNFLIRSIPSEVDPTLISNTDDFKFEVVYWVLMSLYRGEEPDALGRRMKFDEYAKAWKEQRDTRKYELTTGEKIDPSGKSLGLPISANHDSGEFFSGAANDGPNPTSEDLVKNYDYNVFNRPRS